MPDLVSVIVPCYNAGVFLSRALQSIECQQVLDGLKVEVLLIDDASTDAETRGLLNQLSRSDSCTKLIFLERNGGAAHARNKGLELAAGRFVAFLDADDTWRPSHLSTHVSALRESSAVFSCSDYDSIDEGGVVISSSFFANHTIKGSALNKAFKSAAPTVFVEPREMFLRCCPAWTVAVVIDRAKLAQGFVRFDETLSMSEDNHLWMRLAFAGDFCFIPTVTAEYRRNPDSLTRKTGAINRDKWLVVCLEKMLLQREFYGYHSLIRKRISECSATLAYHHRKVGNWKLAKIAAACAIRMHPKSVKAFLEWFKSSARIKPH